MSSAFNEVKQESVTALVDWCIAQALRDFAC